MKPLSTIGRKRLLLTFAIIGGLDKTVSLLVKIHQHLSPHLHHWLELLR